MTKPKKSQKQTAKAHRKNNTINKNVFGFISQCFCKACFRVRKYNNYRSKYKPICPTIKNT